MPEAVPSSSTPPCPVAPLALEAARLIPLVEAEGPDYDPAYQRLAQLERTATSLFASSAEGVFFQALIAYGASDDLNHAIPDEAYGVGQKEAFRQVRHALLSIAHAVRGYDTAPLMRWYTLGDFGGLNAVA